METSRYRVYQDQIKEYLPRKAESTRQSKAKKEASGATGSGTKRARATLPESVKSKDSITGPRQQTWSCTVWCLTY